MRILMLVQHPRIRGPLPKHTPLLIDALRELGCDVETRIWGRHSDTESLLQKFTGRFQDIAEARRTLENEHFDLVVIRTAHDWRTLFRDIWLLTAIRRFRLAKVLQFHGSFSNRLVGRGHRLFKMATSLLLRMSDAALVLSYEEQAEWNTFYPEGRFYRVANPYRRSTENGRRAIKTHWDLPENEAVVLFVGTLKESKGILDLIEAVSLLNARIECHLLVAGDGPELKRVEYRARSLGLNEHVTLAGYLQGEELEAAYQVADVFVLPTYWAEGFPTVIAEAMDAGLPIVTTQTRGAADYLEAETNALFVEPKNPLAIAEAVQLLLSDPVIRAEMGRANRESVSQFAPGKIGLAYKKVLEEIIDWPQPEASLGQSPSSVAKTEDDEATRMHRPLIRK